MTLAGTTAPQGKVNPESSPENNPENEMLDKFDENTVVIVPVNDETKKLRQILSNETSMKILELLKKENLSASEVAEKLELPLTTVKYNIDQLVEYNLAYIQRIKYSEKGRQVKIYEAQEKVIIFAPEKVSRTSLISMLQKYAFAFTAAAFGGFGLNYIYQQHLQRTVAGNARMVMDYTTAAGADLFYEEESLTEMYPDIEPIVPEPMTPAESPITDIPIETLAGNETIHDMIMGFNDWFFSLMDHNTFWFIAGALSVCALIWMIEYISVKKNEAPTNSSSTANHQSE